MQGSHHPTHGGPRFRNGNAMKRGHYTLRRLAALATAIWLVSSPLAWAGPNILLLWDDANDSVSSFPPPVDQLNSNTQSLIGAFEAAGIQVTLSEYTQGSYDGFNPSPTGFDVVVHLNGNSDALDVMMSSGVSILDSYVQNGGGGFITSENSAAQMEIGFGLGLSPTMRNLMLIRRDSGHGALDLTVSVAPGQASHPLWRSLPSSFTVNSGGLVGPVNTYSADPATAIATDDLGSDAVAVREYGAGRAVAFKFAGNSGGADTLSNPDLQQLYVNAVLWADQQPPAVDEIALGSGTPRGGGDLPFTVRFSEGVQGLDTADFEVVATGGLMYDAIDITTVSSREYEVVVRNAENDGTCALNVAADAAITDMSYNENPLPPGGFEGPAYSVDGRRPQVAGFEVDELVVPLGATPLLTITFNEPMNTSISPRVEVATEANGTIYASPEGVLENGLGRAAEGLLALYTFDAHDGGTVHDVSGVGPALDLAIETPEATEWIPGGLRVTGNAAIATPGPAAKIIDAVRASNALTIEAWVAPADLAQTGPARIATLSQDTGARNVTLGQDGTAYQGRLRTTETSDNGIPALKTADGLTATRLQHVVYARDASGQARVFVDGAEAAAETVGGDLSNWDSGYRFGLANEFVRSRAWRGTYRLVAVYGRALSATEVSGHFAAGVLVGGAGDGTWLNSQTYEVSFDRAVVEADEGSAMVVISGAEDLAGNVMRPDDTRSVSLIGSILTIAQQPESYVLALEGESYTFEVVVQGATGAPAYQWYRQVNGNPPEPVGPDAAAYTISQLEEGDAGRYYCVVTDALYSVQTAPSRLLVAESIPAAHGLGLAALALMLAMAAGLCLRPSGRHTKNG